MPVLKLELDETRAENEQEDTGIFLIYEHRGSGQFYFQFHGDKAYFEIYMRLSNLHMTDKLDIQPAQCNADNIMFGLKKVFTIRNTVPVRRIEPARFLSQDMIPDVAVGVPVVTTFHVLLYRFPISWQTSAPDYCPPEDEIDQDIGTRDALLRLADLSIKHKRNLFNKMYSGSFLNSDSDSQKHVPTKTERKKRQVKQTKPTSLRSALQASGFKAETADNSTGKSAETVAAKVEKPKCSKSKHQGNAKTFKRKTKRSGRV